MLVYFNLTSITNVVKSLLLTRGDPGAVVVVVLVQKKHETWKLYAIVPVIETSLPDLSQLICKNMTI